MAKWAYALRHYLGNGQYTAWTKSYVSARYSYQHVYQMIRLFIREDIKDTETVWEYKPVKDE